MRRMLSICTKFESGELFSKGWAALAPKKPPPLVPEHLDRDLGGRGSHGEHLSAGGVEVGGQVLDDALGDEEEGEDEGHGQEDVEGAAHQVHPGIPEVHGAAACDAPDQRHQHRHARGGREEVLHRQTQHLGEVAQGDFAAVGLPVGVGDEAYGRVEGEACRHIALMLGIEGQGGLGLHQEEHRRQAEELDEGDGPGVGLPAHLIVLADAHEAVEAPLEGPQDRVEESAPAVQNPGHVGAQWVGHGQEHGQVQQVLSPGVAHWNVSGFSKAKAR